MTCPKAEYALDMDVDNMCRICLSETDASERLFHIFSSAIVDGFVVAIPDALEFCVDLKVSESDRKPCKICQKCKGQLLGFYLFKQKCQRTDKVLQQALGSSENPIHSIKAPASAKSSSDSEDNVMVEILENGTNYEEDAALEEPESDIEEQMQESTENLCHLCDQIFQTEDDLKEHTVSHCAIVSDKDQESFIEDEQMPEYGSETDDKTAVIRNLEQEEEPVESEYPASANPEDACYLVGDTKMERRISAESLANDQSEHFLVPHEEHDEDSLTTIVPENEEIDDTNLTSYAEESQVELLSCNICRKTIKGRSQYFKHLQTHDVNTNVTAFLTYHICRVCSKVFLEESDYSEHLTATNHSIPAEESPPASSDITGSYACGTCSTKFSRIDHVKQHLLSHLQSFACPFAGCGCEYTSAARLGLHISGKHIEYETHQCQHCGVNTFESMAELQHHLRIKCEGKKYHCDHCDKKFLSSRSLAHHLKCLDKKHRCQECGKTFAQSGELKLHERIHNGERPFKCTVCGKTYKTASLRTAHMDSHIEGKTFQCQLCGKHLQTRTCYRNHIKRHSEERKHECDVCLKKFYTKYNVKVHKQKVHKLMQENVKNS